MGLLRFFSTSCCSARAEGAQAVKDTALQQRTGVVDPGNPLPQRNFERGGADFKLGKSCIDSSAAVAVDPAASVLHANSCHDVAIARHKKYLPMESHQ